MTVMEMTISAAVLAVGVIGSAFCSGTETGVYSLSRIRLSLRASREGDRLARLLKREVERPARALATLLIANTFFNNLGAIGMSALLDGHFSEAGVVVVNVLVLTPLLLVLSDAVPKELFRTDADRLTYYAAPVLVAARWALTVTLVLPLIEWLVRLVGKRLGLAEGSLASPGERIAAMLKEGARHGVLSESQTTLLDRALRLRETTIRGEMVPWSQAQVIAATWPRQRLTEFLATHRRSRYPVVDTGGGVIGVVEHLDLCVYPDRSPTELAHPVVFLDPEESVRDGLMRLRAAGARLGVVRQGGRPAGVVSTADLIEPLVGTGS
jgi:CBS domain containing-hemolysin-like protein